MFHEAGKVGGLSIQLVCFRGLSDFQASPWLDDPQMLADAMAEVDCRGGQTQLGKVLQHVLSEAARERVDAVVYVGDCFEESAELVSNLAGKIALHGVPIFVFHEGRNPSAASVFKELARITRGAYCPFDAGSAKQLAELLRAVAVYAAGGPKALADHVSREGGMALLIADQMAR
jgi:hypothetical protein